MLYWVFIYVTAAGLLTFLFIYFMSVFKKEQVLSKIYSHLPKKVITSLEEDAKKESRDIEQQIAQIIKRYYL